MATTDGNLDKLDNLSEVQKLALESYISVTDQDAKEAIPLLRRSQWNVEIAVAKFFDGEGPDPVLEALASQGLPPHRAGRQENLQESLLYENGRISSQKLLLDPAPRIVPQVDNDLIHRPPLLLAVFFAPFNFFYRLMVSSYSVLTYFFSFSNFRPRNFTSHQNSMGRRPLKPRDAAARLRRDFEEEYGRQSLPFFEDGYAQALDIAKSQFKILIILLLSPEHDDTASFVRDTLLDTRVQEYLHKCEKNVIIWAGDVRDSEAYQVSTAVKCTKFPFTAVVAHTPDISSNSMSVILSITGVIDTATYLKKLGDAIKKCEKKLSDARASRDAQDYERSLRQEQNSAYERSLAQDKERARIKKDAEAAAAKLKLQELANEKAAILLAENRLLWRRWRASNIRPEPEVSEGDIVRIALKMPEDFSASRIIRRFRAGDPIEELYAFVDCYEFLQNGNCGEILKPSNYDHHYQFLLVQSLPRFVYRVDDGGTIGEKIGKSANLIVELVPLEDQELEEE